MVRSFLSGLNYTIRHRPTKEHSNCDALSRLAIPVDNTSLKEDPAAIFQLRQLESIPLSSDDIRKQTRKDPVLSLVYNAIQSGNWLNRTGEFEPFYSRRDELSTHSGVMFWGSRIVIQCKQRNRVMEELHENHDGIVKMKALARSYVWYPGIDREIEQKVKNCKMCALHQSNPPESKLHSWGYPDSPFERIHIDFASYEGRQLLVMVDAYSKWPIVDIKNSTATAGVVESLRSVFATYGLPKMIVSDNAMSFMSTEFQEFCSKNGVKHITGPPFNPKNNGQAEIMVKVLKQKLATMKHKQITLQHKIANFLMSYRNAPHVTTGERPCMLMFNRSLRTRFDIMRPSLKDIVQTSQAKSPKNQLNLRHFDVGQSVVVRDYRGSTNKVKWQPGVVKKRNGPVNYEIETVQGYIWRRHADQIRKTGERVTSTTEEMDLDNYVLEEDDCDSKTK